MPESYKICPICGASNHPTTPVCLTCGAELSQSETLQKDVTAPKEQRGSYDFRYGETDLLEGNLQHVGQKFLYATFGILVLLMVGGLILAISPMLFSSTNNVSETETAIEENFTNTPIPIPDFPTVTPGTPTDIPPPTDPPTLTPSMTFTPEPCIQTVQAGEGLYSVVLRCGHRDLAVIDLVVELNNLGSAESVQEGQQIIIPYPTPTFDPNAVPTEAPTNEASSDANAGETVAVRQLDVFDEDYDPLAIPTATLAPGIDFHTVLRDENIITIAVQYNVNVEILSQINPEIQFSQCDFGETYGGPRCIVLLIEGQRIRVPAPTPLATLSPTPSGSETATPTPTATFNAPSVISPSDRFFYDVNSLVTLRWIGSGTLGEEQSYRVNVQDVTSGIVYITDTTENTLILPTDWQGDDGERHEYIWTVSVIDLDNPSEPYFVTEPQTFFWQAQETEG